MNIEEMDDILGDLDDIIEQEPEVTVEAEVVDESANFDEVLSGFQSMAEDLAGNEKDPVKVAKASQKFDSLSSAFGVTSEEMEDELQGMVTDSKRAAVEYVEAGLPVTSDIKQSAFNIDALSGDFLTMRETLIDSLKDSRAIQKKFTDEMLMTTIDDISPTTLMGYSELMKAVTKQVEVLGKIYKDVAETQVKLKAYLKQEQAVEDQEGAPGTTNIQNNYILSTKDLIDKFNPS